MAEHPVGHIVRSGEKFPLRVDDDGNWLATAAGRPLKKPTRKELVSEIDRILRLHKRAVHIPITLVVSKNHGYITLRHGTVTGVHGGNGNVTVAWDDGTSGQIVSHGETVLSRLDDDETAEITRLTKEAYEASERLREFTGRKHVYNGVKGLIRQVGELLAKDGR